MVFDLGWISVTARQGATVHVLTCKKGAIAKGPLPSLCFEPVFSPLTSQTLTSTPVLGAPVPTVPVVFPQGFQAPGQGCYADSTEMPADDGFLHEGDELVDWKHDSVGDYRDMEGSYADHGDSGHHAWGEFEGECVGWSFNPGNSRWDPIAAA